jgi:hypothetical protein
MIPLGQFAPQLHHDFFDFRRDALPTTVWGTGMTTEGLDLNFGRCLEALSPFTHPLGVMLEVAGVLAIAQAGLFLQEAVQLHPFVDPMTFGIHASILCSTPDRLLSGYSR